MPDEHPPQILPPPGDPRRTPEPQSPDPQPTQSPEAAGTPPAPEQEQAAGATRFGLRGRLKATGVHLALSTLAFLAVLYYILYLWYPAPHFTITGGWQGVRIMLGVDLVLGPLMTLIIFNPRKRPALIAMDLAIIASVQIGAFIWGAQAVHGQHPVTLTLWQGIFYPVLEEDYTSWGKNPQPATELSPEHPPLVYLAETDVFVERTLLELNRDPRAEELSDPRSMVQIYKPLQEHLDALAAASLDKVSADPRVPPALEKYRSTHPRAAWFIPFRARYGTSLLIFDSNGRLLDSMNDPRDSTAPP